MSLEKLDTQVDSELLNEMRALAKSEGRHLQALVNEAFRHYLQKHNQQRPRSRVMATYQASHDRYAYVYQKLAE